VSHPSVQYGLPDRATINSTFHSDFNVDIEEASMAVDNFEKHLKSISRGIQDIRDIWPKQRQAMKGFHIPLSSLERGQD